MQLSASATPPRQQLQILDSHHPTQRHALSRNLSPLRDPLLHRHIHLDRITPRPPRPYPGLRTGPRRTLRERMRTRPDFQL